MVVEDAVERGRWEGVGVAAAEEVDVELELLPPGSDSHFPQVDCFCGGDDAIPAVPTDCSMTNGYLVFL